MRRFVFYIAIALLTFTIGSFIAFNFGQKAQKVQVNVEKIAKLKAEMQTYQNFSGFAETFIGPKQQTIKEKNEKLKPFCNDKKILPIWNKLKKDEHFREWEEGFYESVDCADMLEVTEFDLNQDKQKEILLRGKNFNTCSVVGNCGFWIFEKRGKTYRKLLSSTDYIDITKMPDQVEKSMTRGYFNILLKGHLDSSDTHYIFYKFNGSKYEQRKCLVNTRVWWESDTDSKPKWEFITCREYHEQNSWR
ncbi:MAG: hypothetical protein ABI954_09435 [Pyrinomonadaceae bacterium]